MKFQPGQKITFRNFFYDGDPDEGGYSFIVGDDGEVILENELQEINWAKCQAGWDEEEQRKLVDCGIEEHTFEYRTDELN